MAFNTFLTAVFLLCCVNGGLFKELPGYINVCKRDQETINTCARQAVESLRSTLIKGIPELDVPGIDPFFIKEFAPAPGGAIPLNAVGKDVKVTGAGNFSIKSLDVDLDTLVIKGRVRFPKLHFDGRYKLDTQLVVLPLAGEGKLNADAVKCDADLVLHGATNTVDGQDYVTFTKLDLAITIKDYRIHLDGLFNGDKVLGEAANLAINQNRVEFLRSAKPYVEKAVAKLLLDLANKIVKDFTIDQLLPKP